MIDQLYKHVLFKDLQDYLKRDDYLGGFTTTEQNWIRKNIGALSQKDAQAILDRQISGVKLGTYKEINKLVKEGQLIPGFLYVITDYQTIYQSYELNESGQYITWGDNINPSEEYNIILIAYSNSQFLKKVSIISNNPNSLLWTVAYEFESIILSDGKSTKGQIVYLQDENNNIANYDFKNIKNINGYVFEKDGTEGSQYYTNNNLINCYNISFKDISNHNIISGNNIVIETSIDNLRGNMSNVKINTSDLSLDNDSIKQVLKLNDVYYLDYLDLETLTHQFYAIDTIQ